MMLKRIFISLLCLLPLASVAQSLSPAQIEQFRALPRAQQEALAKQYGVDLNSLGGSGGGSVNGEALRNPEPVVTPLNGQAPEGMQPQQDEDDGEAELSDKDGLKPFGYTLFAGSPSTFAPVTSVPVPSEYTIGPGDEIRVQMWGKENHQLNLVVDRNGVINFPEIGPEAVAGMSFADLKERINALVDQHFIGLKASVSLGELRSMRVFVLGEARHPGSYTVSSLSTLTNALYVSGGISHSGSLRNIEHRRNGKLVGVLDLYQLLLKGDSRGDSRMQPGDVIFIPPVGKRVGIKGEVYRPALYELKRESRLAELVKLAGGLTPQAYPQRVNIERTNSDYLRVIAEADYSSVQGRNARVVAGDTVHIPSISEITGQYIEVRGAATRPGKFAWMPGMRVSSLIGSLDADLLPIADKHYAAIVRTDANTDRISVLSLNLRQALQAPGSEADVALSERDEILVFADAGKVNDSEGNEDGSRSREKIEIANPLKQERDPELYTREALFAPVLQRLKAQAGPAAFQQTIQVSGPVRYPGEYPLPASGRLIDAIAVAGGLTDSASLHLVEVARSSIEGGLAKTRVLTVSLADIMSGQSQMQLQSRDTVLIKSIPQFGKVRRVTLSGEVLYPGEYTFRDGETLRDVLKRAGGLTDNAFPRGAVFTREKLRQLEAKRLKEAEERLQGDLLGVQLEAGKDARSADRVQQVENLLEDVQSSRPIGRMVIDLAAILEERQHQSVRLQDGDELTVPSIPQSVSVFGEVQFPTSHMYQPGLTVADYLDRSGGPTRQADESRAYVVKADGSVLMPQRSRWFGGRGQQLEPGDTIIMPIDVDRLNKLELWSNVSQIVYQMALGAAAVGNL